MNTADHLRARAQAYRDDANGLRRSGHDWTDTAILDAVADELTRLAIELDHLQLGVTTAMPTAPMPTTAQPVGVLAGTFAWRCTDPDCAVTGIGGPDAAIHHYLDTHHPHPTYGRNHPCLTTTESPASR